MADHCVVFGYLPAGEKFEHHGIEFEVVGFERARQLDDESLWFFDVYQPVFIDSSRLMDIGSPTKGLPHKVCHTSCPVCQGDDPKVAAVREFLQQVKMEPDENATLGDLPEYQLECLAMLEFLRQLGFSFEQLAFMPDEHELAIAIHIEDLKIVERVNGNEFYPIKVIDLPRTVTWKTAIAEWATASIAWKEATQEQQLAVLDRSKVKMRMPLIRTELDKAGLLPTRQN